MSSTSDVSKVDTIRIRRGDVSGQQVKTPQTMMLDFLSKKAGEGVMTCDRDHI